MKEYDAKSKLLNVLSTFASALYGILYYFDSQKLLQFANTYLLCLTVFVLITPYKYFPVCTTLRIDEQQIAKRGSFGIITRSIPYENAHVGFCYLHGMQYAIFSSVPIPPDKWKKLRLVYQRKAILYPFSLDMMMDFPDLFLRERNFLLRKYAFVPPKWCSITLYGIFILAIALLFTDLFPMSSIAGGIFLLVLFTFCALTPIKYFCGIVAIYVDEKRLNQKWFGIITCQLAFDHVHVRSMPWLGKYFKVFSKNDLSGKSRKEIFRAVRKKEAMVYPWVPEMERDFPDLLS